MKLTVKITLNSDDPFDVVIIKRVQGEANKAAVLKHIAYEALQGRAAAPAELAQAKVPEPPSAPVSVLDLHINAAADRLLDQF